MYLSKTIIAIFTFSILSIFNFNSANAIQPATKIFAEQSLVTQVKHHKKRHCVKWKWDDYGDKYCYKWKHKYCYKWKYDKYGDRYCSKWKWGYKYHKGHKGGYGY